MLLILIIFRHRSLINSIARPWQPSTFTVVIIVISVTFGRRCYLTHYWTIIYKITVWGEKREIPIYSEFWKDAFVFREWKSTHVQHNVFIAFYLLPHFFLLLLFMGVTNVFMVSYQNRSLKQVGPECVIQFWPETDKLFILGETSSGKSTLLNLILGEQLLPYSVLSTTSTICELKYDTTPRLVAHFKDKDPETGLTTKTVFLGEPPETSQQSYLKQISSFVHVKTNREKGSDYEKIELFWPHSLLKVGDKQAKSLLSLTERQLVIRINNRSICLLCYELRYFKMQAICRRAS